MTNHLTYIILGAINQHQIWFKQGSEKMTAEENSAEKDEKNVQVRVQGGSSGAVYGLGVIGACIYYMSHATTPQEKAIGFLKGLIWPVYLVKGVLELLEKK